LSLTKPLNFLAVNNYPRYFRGIWSRTKRKIIQVQLKLLGVRSPWSVAYYGMPIISMERGSTIDIGENSVICSDSKIAELGVNHPVIMRTLRPGANIIIGQDTGISGGAICAAVSVKIGNECLIGANVVIADTDFHPINPIGRRYSKSEQDITALPIEIEDNVFIGTGSIILKGVRVGKNSVIGAGSVVTKDVPPDSVVAGNPAKILRKI
jgi:acetyltransferase-like isoleucine patch superfamily enzyme